MAEKELKMKETANNKSLKSRSWLQFLMAAAAIILFASLSSFLRIRLDLTEDKRYTLSEQTRKVLRDLKNDIYIQVYLDGEIPIPLKRLKRSVREMLDEFRIASGRKIDYEFINHSGERDTKKMEAKYHALANKGFSPVNIQSGDAEGGSTQKIIFP